MSLSKSIKELYARRRFGIKPGVDRVRLMLERLGHPEQNFRSIHVVGTNGKGSVSASLESILSAAGLKTALFTSPHLVNFNERFRINGQKVANQELEQLLSNLLKHAPQEATFFEIVTVLAALCFANHKSDVAIIEAGMGGKSDATALIPALMTVITPISIDHTEYLGTTVAQIAAEKVAIAERCTPVISALQPTEALKEIKKLCSAGNNQLLVAGIDFKASWNNNSLLDYQGLFSKLTNLKPGIPGRYQSDNAALALAAAEMLSFFGMKISSEAMEKGLKAANWPGRMELLAGSPRILLDGAHNAAGATALAEALADYSYKRLLMVTGVMSDKEAEEIFRPFAGKVYKIYTVQPAVERSLDDKALSLMLEKLGIKAISCGTVANGVEIASREASGDDLVLVCGSLFLVGEAKAYLTGQYFEGVRG